VALKREVIYDQADFSPIRSGNKKISSTAKAPSLIKDIRSYCLHAIGRHTATSYYAIG
jgi:hypothetical protein